MSDLVRNSGDRIFHDSAHKVSCTAVSILKNNDRLSIQIRAYSGKNPVKGRKSVIFGQSVFNISYRNVLELSFL